ncbi:hypothetical protein BD779DRAFT_1485747 [Infundibulicybe gibba]|nr:hypothetical protein BD779DRAFT_1485747 [Infundibulicybe gibba]
MHIHQGQTETPEQQNARHIAATRIQRLWRQKHNTARNQYMSTELRWNDAVTHTKLAVGRKAAMDGQNSPRNRWKRAVFLVGRLRDGNEMLGQSGVQVEAEDKHLETQHWLELIDGKHRYGSNR